MSNAMAIAAVTHVMKGALRFHLSDRLMGLNPEVWSLPPDMVETRIDQDNNVINLFMYRSTYNQGWRNESLPSRNHVGEVLTKPKLGLDLYYMLSCYGSDELYGEMMLGYAMQVLHDNPILARQYITNELNDLSSIPGTTFDEVVASNLSEQLEMVKIVPDAINTEELSRLWTSFGSKYRLSSFYRVSVVLIESEAPERIVLPVEKPMLYVRPFSEPEITVLQALDSLTASPIDILLIKPKTFLRLRGNSLLGDTTEVMINGVSETIVGNPTNEGIIVSLPNSLAPGLQSVQITHKLKLGDPPVDHKGADSNVKAFILNPHFNNVVLNAGNISLDISSPIEAEQIVSLLLNEQVSPTSTNQPNNYVFEFTHVAAVAAGTIVIPIQGIVAGDYIVRLKVDKYISIVPRDDIASYIVSIP